MLNNFIYAQTKDLFLEKLNAGEVLDEAIVFIEDTKEIWTHGTYFDCSTFDPDIIADIQTEIDILKKKADEAASMIPITYAELKSLRDNGELTPGMQYRITDYVTTTKQDDTKSAGHQFDIIVTSDSENTLNEKARAIQHEGDTYFANSNLDAWEIWYSLDNDTSRFAWADNTIQNWKAEIIGCYIEDPDPNIGTAYSIDKESKIYDWDVIPHPDSGEDTVVFYTQDPLYFDEAGPDYIDGFIYNGIVTVDGIEYDSWKKYNMDADCWVNEGLYSLTKRMVYDNEVIWPETDATNSEVGKGVIYRMIDEFNNDCPYDFKNIQFWRRLSFKNGYAEFSEDGDLIWVYTFAGQSYHINNDSYSDMLDGSLESPFSHMSYGELSTFHDNIIKPYIIADNDNDLYSKCGVRYLNHNVLLGWWQEIGSGNEEETLFYYAHCCYSNNFGNNSFGNSLSNDCYDNNFGNNCINNKLYHGCHSNNFGNNCGYNILSIGCNSNSFGNACNNNYFYDDVNSNIFGDGCFYNKLYRQCSANRFSNFNSYNTLGDSCNYNSFENRCNNNSFGHDCCRNSFGNECYDNSFGNNCYDNSFGDSYIYNSFGSACFRNSFENKCSNNSFGHFYYGNSFGDRCTYNSFGHQCIGNSFGNNCCYNSFGNNCIFNSFRLSASTTTSLLDYCQCNHFDDGCSYNVIWNDVQPTSSNMLQNINVVRGVSGNSNEYNYINITDTDKDYEIKVAKNSKGEIKIYCEADLIA